MYNMMNNSIGSGWVMAWSVHAISVTLFAIGILLLVAYAAKRLTDAQLKTWGIGFAIAGTILCLLALAAWPAMGSWGRYGQGRMMGVYDQNFQMDNVENRFDEMDEHMDDMMDDEDDHSMTMDDMTRSLEGLKGDAFDEAFIRAMIPHHQGAIDMARAVQENAGHEELRQMAEEIISAQQAEIEMMNGWLRDWGYEE